MNNNCRNIEVGVKIIFENVIRNKIMMIKTLLKALTAFGIKAKTTEKIDKDFSW